MEKSIVSTTYSLFNQDFELIELGEDFNEETAIAALSKAVAHFPDRNFGRLLQICYRVDLGETLLKQILYGSQPDRVAEDLAQTLWHRQKQKIEIRQRYSGK